jgi:hypothetical protein
VGYQAALANTTGNQSVAVGAQALLNTTTGYQLTAVGYQALKTNTTGNFNVAVGIGALTSNTTAGQNVGVGYFALGTNTTGQENTAIGHGAMTGSTTGSDNAALGSAALSSNSTGANNTAVGRSALLNNTTASNNTAVGYQAGYSNTTGTAITVVGYQAGYASTGFGNTCIGYLAGNYTTTITTGGGNILLGPYSKPAASSNDYSVIIGWNSVGKGSSTGIIGGGDGGTSAMYQGNNSSTWSVTSDQRLKKNIVDNTVGLAAITQIRVRNFEYRLPEEVTDVPQDQAIPKQGVQLGVIAQELQAVLPDCVKQESTGVLSVDADNLTWYLVNAIKELKAEFDAYKSTHP